MTQTPETRNRWLILAVICIPVFVGSLDLTVVSAFLPELIIDLELPLQTGLDDAAWIVSAYLLAYTIGLTFMGRVSDLIGRRWVYAICLLIFIAGSVLVAIAHEGPTDFLYRLYRRAGERPDIAFVNLQAIIFGRVIQALGAGALVPVSLALVGDIFLPEHRAQPMGLVAAVDTMGWVLGHLYGGIFVQRFDWQFLFWINVPLTLFTLIITLWALRNVPDFRTKGRFDFLGLLFITTTLVCLNVGLGANTDFGSVTSLENLSSLPPYAIPLLSAAAVFFVLFILVESRVRYPLIPLSLFKRRNLSAGAATSLLIGYCLFIGLVSVPILVNVRQADSSTLTEAALQVGLMLSALTIPMAISAYLGGWLTEHIGYGRTTVAGLSIAIIGFLLVWQTWHLDVSDMIIVSEMALIGIGIGLTFSPVSAAMINAATDKERGVASALILILRLTGMAISSSSLTAFSLQRVNVLAYAELGVDALDTSLYVDVYAQITVQVLAEVGLIGAILCGIAIIPGSLMREERAILRPYDKATVG